MLVTGTIPERLKAVWLSSPGTWTRIAWPGLKPSLRFHSVGLIGTPFLFLGIDAGLRFSRRPVEVGALRVKRLLGQGKRQTVGSSQSQRPAFLVLIRGPR